MQGKEIKTAEWLRGLIDRSFPDCAGSIVVEGAPSAECDPEKMTHEIFAHIQRPDPRYDFACLLRDVRFSATNNNLAAMYKNDAPFSLGIKLHGNAGPGYIEYISLGRMQETMENFFAAVAGINARFFKPEFSDDERALFARIMPVFTACHELTHAVLHMRGIVMPMNEEENCADMFASLIILREFGYEAMPFLDRLRDCRLLGALHTSPVHFTTPGVQEVLAMLGREGLDEIAAQPPGRLFRRATEELRMLLPKPYAGLREADIGDLAANRDFSPSVLDKVKKLSPMFNEAAGMDYQQTLSRYVTNTQTDTGMQRFLEMKIMRKDGHLMDSAYGVMDAAAIYFAHMRGAMPFDDINRYFDDREKSAEEYEARLIVLDKILPGLGTALDNFLDEASVKESHMESLFTRDRLKRDLAREVALSALEKRWAYVSSPAFRCGE